MARARSGFVTLVDKIFVYTRIILARQRHCRLLYYLAALFVLGIARLGVNHFIFGVNCICIVAMKKHFILPVVVIKIQYDYCLTLALCLCALFVA